MGEPHEVYANSGCIVMRVPGAGEARLERGSVAQMLNVPVNALRSETGVSLH